MAAQVPLLYVVKTAASAIPFSSTFHQPTPPAIKPAFTANFNQHKWDQNVSHITSGFWYSSPSAKKVRIDEAYDLTLASSLFDYHNVSAKGVNNVMWYLNPSIVSTPQFFEGYVSNPSFPLFRNDLLVASQAVYAGVTEDPDFGELIMVCSSIHLTTQSICAVTQRSAWAQLVATNLTLVQWNILYAGSIPATVLVDNEGIIHGFDYWSPNKRTYVITRLFNIIAKEPSVDVFEFPKPG